MDFARCDGTASDLDRAFERCSVYRTFAPSKRPLRSAAVSRGPTWATPAAREGL